MAVMTLILLILIALVVILIAKDVITSLVNKASSVTESARDADTAAAKLRKNIGKFILEEA